MPDTPLHYLTITELAARIETRQISPVEITEAMLRRIENLDAKYRSYATVMADQAEAAAKAAEAEIAAGQYRGPLHGVPFAVKDLCFTTASALWAAARSISTTYPHSMPRSSPGSTPPAPSRSAS